MPILIFAIDGVPDGRRQQLSEAVESAGKSLRGSHEAWIVPARLGHGFYVRITGPEGFFRQADFQGEETGGEIAERLMNVLTTA